MNDLNKSNADPITGEEGAHPVGTGVGATAGAIAGAALGTIIAGPLGTIVGGVAGAVSGGLAGKSVAESENPTVGANLEEEHPVGTAVGASGGALTGALAGAVGGPIGMAAGAVIGAAAGGLMGKGGAEVVNPSNRDDLNDHHLAKGTGAGAGALTGAAFGAVAGPVGSLAGAAIGAVAGGLAGRGIGEVANPKADDHLARHNLGTGVGASSGALAGAVAGSVAGPVGALAGAAIGAVAGGAAGHGTAVVANPKAEDAYWSNNFQTHPGYVTGYTYDDYGPAYRYGVDQQAKYRGQRFTDVESRMAAEWATIRHTSRLEWNQAKVAASAAWDRVERAIPGDSDHDGK